MNLSWTRLFLQKGPPLLGLFLYSKDTGFGLYIYLAFIFPQIVSYIVLFPQRKKKSPTNMIAGWSNVYPHLLCFSEQNRVRGSSVANTCTHAETRDLGCAYWRVSHMFVQEECLLTLHSAVTVSSLHLLLNVHVFILFTGFSSSLVVSDLSFNRSLWFCFSSFLILDDIKVIKCDSLLTSYLSYSNQEPHLHFEKTNIHSASWSWSLFKTFCHEIT